MIVGLSQRAGRPFTRRWLRLAGPPHTTQIAWSLSTISATASKVGIGPNGNPRKSMSIPASMTRTPRSARSLAAATISPTVELHLVHGDHLGVGSHRADHALGGIHRLGLDRAT